MHILITGSAGFLGFHFARHLLNAGTQVTLVDRFSDYYSRDLKLLRAQTLKTSFGATTLNIDLAKSEELQQLSSHSFTHIVHLAGQPGVRVTEANQLNYLSDNITGFTNLIALAVRQSIPNFIYASSSSIYQKARILPFSESETLEIPSNFYARTKYLDEKIAESFSGSLPNMCGLRFFSVYGPWGRPDMAYFKLFQSAYSSKEFVLNGTGEISRDFTFVDDVINAIAKLVNLQGTYPKVLNVGGGNVNSMNHLISAIQEITGRKINVSRRPTDMQDLQTTSAETSLQDETLGLLPKTSLQNGLIEVNSWIQSLEGAHDFLKWV